MIMILIAGLIGLLSGYALSLIAPEELKDGKKYLIILRRALFVAISLIILYGLWSTPIYFILVLISMIILTYLIEWKSIFFQIFVYALFIGIQFLINQEIITTLLFLYGFPVAALIQCHLKKI
jgi:hypothetical protein